MAVRPLQPHLVIFARRPQLGVGKRRLAADVGDVRAVRFARMALDRLVRTLGRDPRWRLWMAISPDRPADWVRRGDVLAQGSGDLGQRLTRVIEALPPGPVVILGSDTPTVTRADVAAAFQALKGSQSVFGPATDGGYWLIGLRRGVGERLPFESVRWSGPHALADTLANLEGCRIAHIREREDIDDGSTLARFEAGLRAQFEAGRGRA